MTWDILCDTQKPSILPHVIIHGNKYEYLNRICHEIVRSNLDGRHMAGATQTSSVAWHSLQEELSSMVLRSILGIWRVSYHVFCWIRTVARGIVYQACFTYTFFERGSRGAS